MIFIPLCRRYLLDKQIAKLAPLLNISLSDLMKLKTSEKVLLPKTGSSGSNSYEVIDGLEVRKAAGHDIVELKCGSFPLNALRFGCEAVLFICEAKNLSLSDTLLPISCINLDSVVFSAAKNNEWFDISLICSRIEKINDHIQELTRNGSSSALIMEEDFNLQKMIETLEKNRTHLSTNNGHILRSLFDIGFSLTEGPISSNHESEPNDPCS